MTSTANKSGASRRNILIGLPLAATAAALPVEAAEPMWSAQYQAKKDGVTLALYRKRLTAPQPGGPKLPVLFLVHGSTVAALTSFDLTVPGAGEYSMMDVFARYGFDVWSMDFQGYGKSSMTNGNSDIAMGVSDLRTGTELVARETGQEKFHFMGESAGAIRAGAFAVAEPQRVDRLVLEAFTYTGKGSPTLSKRSERLAYFKTHNRRPRGPDDIRSITTRDKPGTTDPRVADAMVKADMQYGDSVPTGTYLDMTANLPLVDPSKVESPVLLIRGQYDGISTEADLIDFFTKLPNQDREYAVVAGAAHSIIVSVNRAALWHTMNAFLTMPKTVPI